jgi:hypothetical protein
MSAKLCSRYFRYTILPLNMAIILDTVYCLEFLSQNQNSGRICPYSYGPLKKIYHWASIGVLFQFVPI